MMDKIRKLIRRNKFLFYGLPMIIFIVAGSVGLKEFTAIKYNYRDEKIRMLTAEEKLAFHQRKEKRSLHEEYEETMEQLDIDHWKNKRGPRPWETQSKD